MESLYMIAGAVLLMLIVGLIIGGSSNTNVASANLEESGFHVDKTIGISETQDFFVDDVNKKIAITTGTQRIIIKYDEIISFELNEDGNSVTQGKGLAAAVGGLTFGLVGAVAGAAGARNIKSTCSSLVLRVMINDLKLPLINMNFITAEAKKDSVVYQNALKNAHEVIATLTYITNKVGCTQQEQDGQRQQANEESIEPIQESDAEESGSEATQSNGDSDSQKEESESKATEPGNKHFIIITCALLIVILWCVYLIADAGDISKVGNLSWITDNSASSAISSDEEISQKNAALLKEREERKKRLESELNELHKQLRSNTDEIEGIKWIHDKSTPVRRGDNNFYIYLGQRGNLTWARLFMGFQRDEWVFMNTIIINVDGRQYTIDVPYSERKSDVLYDGTIAEYVDLPADDYTNIIKTISNGEKVLVRYRGDQYRHDVQLSKTQVSAIKRIYRIYEVYRALREYE